LFKDFDIGAIPLIAARDNDKSSLPERPVRAMPIQSLRHISRRLTEIHLRLPRAALKADERITAGVRRLRKITKICHHAFGNIEESDRAVRDTDKTNSATFVADFFGNSDQGILWLKTKRTVK